MELSVRNRPKSRVSGHGFWKIIYKLNKQNWRIPKGFPIGLKFVLMFENRINTQSNKELENSKGFFHDKIVKLLRLGAAQANV